MLGGVVTRWVWRMGPGFAIFGRTHEFGSERAVCQGWAWGSMGSGLLGLRSPLRVLKLRSRAARLRSGLGRWGRRSGHEKSPVGLPTGLGARVEQGLQPGPCSRTVRQLHAACRQAHAKPGRPLGHCPGFRQSFGRPPHGAVCRAVRRQILLYS